MERKDAICPYLRRSLSRYLRPKAQAYKAKVAKNPATEFRSWPTFVVLKKLLAYSNKKVRKRVDFHLGERRRPAEAGQGAGVDLDIALCHCIAPQDLVTASQRRSSIISAKTP